MAEWMWYPGEFEIRTLNEVGRKRYLRDVIQPPVWQSYAVEPSVKFCKEFTLERDDVLTIRASGEFNLELDAPGEFVHGFSGTLTLPKGKHSLCVHVFCSDGKIPCLYIKGNEVCSDSSWQCTLLDGKFVRVGTGGFTDIEVSPNDYALPLERKTAVKVVSKDGYRLYDFGEETFGYTEAEGSNGKGVIKLYFGESREEAEDFSHCEQTGRISLEDGKIRSERTNAFRYVAAVCERGAEYRNLAELYEYRHESRQAVFECENKELQAIWDTAKRTFGLNTREFFLDGIKRDRWVWSGDASQSYLLNRYSFADDEVARATIVALGGKGRATKHINTIADYTLYWLISCYTHYRYTSDKEFLRGIYSRFAGWMNFVVERTDGDGFLRHNADDWVFIDWSDALTKDGEVYSFLQILLYGAYSAAEKITEALGKKSDSENYGKKAVALKNKIEEKFWCEGKHGYAHSLKGGKSDGLVLRQNNVMAVLCGVADDDKKRQILRNVLLDPSIPAITTPYMRFYEFTALCMLGETERVYKEMFAYFGGMLKEGATSFWEYYDPEEKGAARYAMYGRKYGKSLCHAWGATPLWIIGRYLIGLNPASDGCDKIRLCPKPELLGNCKAEFPLAKGTVRLKTEGDNIQIVSSLHGVAVIGGESVELLPEVAVSRKWK